MEYKKKYLKYKMKYLERKNMIGGNNEHNRRVVSKLESRDNIRVMLGEPNSSKFEEKSKFEGKFDLMVDIRDIDESNEKLFGVLLDFNTEEFYETLYPLKGKISLFVFDTFTTPFIYVYVKTKLFVWIYDLLKEGGKLYVESHAGSKYDQTIIADYREYKYHKNELDKITDINYFDNTTFNLDESSMRTDLIFNHSVDVDKDLPELIKKIKDDIKEMINKKYKLKGKYLEHVGFNVTYHHNQEGMYVHEANTTLKYTKNYFICTKPTTSKKNTNSKKCNCSKAY